MAGWIGVDLDGTLALYPYEFPEIGPPIPAMVERVKGWLAEGKDVRIFTARAHVSDDPAWVASAAALGHTAESWPDAQTKRIQAWCAEYLGVVLPITCEKDFQMIELWDDRCVQIITNTGLTAIEHAIAQTVEERRAADGQESGRSEPV